MMATDKSPAVALPAEEGGFLSRWAQRKQALAKGVELVDPPKPAAPAVASDLKQKERIAHMGPALSAPDLIVKEGDAPAAPELPPAPTMEDTRSLTPQSDFKPFMRADVLPQVKNAAMKQLFKDPHFNVMDMMDIYVDDYSKPDPLPPEMLRKMAVTQFLGFWKEEEEAEAKKLADEQKAREDAQAAHKETVAQSGLDEATPVIPKESQPEALDASASHHSHDHPDLQLQPNDAARRDGIVKSAG